MPLTTSSPATPVPDGVSPAPKANSPRTGDNGVRPEIQALRALAVGIVVLWHLWPNTVFTGGFVGVDVFFAISGFLITAHLLREVTRTGRISLPNFWAKRARRLLPASLVVLVATAIATVIWVPKALWIQFFNDIAASGLYIQNWHLATSSVDYLDAANKPSAVQHYWSLSAEEQFYIIWPLLMVLAIWFAAKRSVRTRTLAIGTVLGVVVLASFIFSVWYTATNPAPAYLITPTRAWEFGLGGLLAIFAGGVSKAPAALRALVSWLGLAAILITAVVYTEDGTPFPSWQAGIPVLGTLAVIWAGNPDLRWAPSRLASIRPVQWLGDVSYSVYLWHFPLIIIVPYALGSELHAPTKIAVLVATLLLAWASKNLIEDPVRQGRWLATHKPRWTFAATAAAMVIVVGGSYAVVNYITAENAKADAGNQDILLNAPECVGLSITDGSKDAKCVGPYDLGDKVIPSQDVFSTERPEIYSDECRSTDGETEVKDCTFGDESSDTVVALVGDSHAAQWFPTLKALAEKEKFALHVFFKSGCPFTDMTVPDSTGYSSGCADWNANAITAVEDLPGLDLVATSATRGYSADTDKAKEVRVASYQSRLQSIADLGIPVLVFQDTPKMSDNAIECLTTSSDEEIRDCGSSKSKALEKPDLLVQAAGNVSDATVVSINDQLCKKDFCPGVIGDVIAYRDNSSHMTTTFATSLAVVLKDQFDSVLAGK